VDGIENEKGMCWDRDMREANKRGKLEGRSQRDGEGGRKTRKIEEKGTEKKEQQQDERRRVEEKRSEREGDIKQKREDNRPNPPTPLPSPNNPPTSKLF